MGCQGLRTCSPRLFTLGWKKTIWLSSSGMVLAQCLHRHQHLLPLVWQLRTRMHTHTHIHAVSYIWPTRSLMQTNGIKRVWLPIRRRVVSIDLHYHHEHYNVQMWLTACKEMELVTPNHGHHGIQKKHNVMYYSMVHINLKQVD